MGIFGISLAGGIGMLSATAANAPAAPTFRAADGAADAPAAPIITSTVPGAGSVTVSWTQPAGGEIDANPALSYVIDVYGGTGSTLVATKADCGTSPCLVTGLAGGVPSWFSVKVTDSDGESATSAVVGPVTPIGAPAAPSGVTATSNGDRSSIVAWTAPTSTGGSPITHYTATAAPGGASCVTPDGATTTCTLTGLSNGTPYAITVTATNLAGTSDPSAPPTSATPAAVPDAPGVALSATSISSITLSVTPPANDGGSPITGYVVELNGVPLSGVVQLTGGTLVVSSLSADTGYTIAAAALNAPGQGAWSAPLSVTTKVAGIKAVLPKVGSSLLGTHFDILGSGLKPGSVVGLSFHSTPVDLGSAVVATDGSYSLSSAFPTVVTAEVHRLILTGTSPTGDPVVETWYLDVGTNGILLSEAGPNPVPLPTWAQPVAAAAPSTVVHSALSAPQVATPTPSVTPVVHGEIPRSAPVTVVGGIFSGYNPFAHVGTFQTVAVGAAVMMALLSATATVGGVSVAGGVAAKGGVEDARKARGEGKREAGIEHTKIKYHHLGVGAVALNERSLTWRLAATDVFVVGMGTIAYKLGRLSQALFKIADDGAYLRASLGIFSVVTYVLAAVLGVASVASTHGAAVPPTWPLFAALVALGILDAFAGLIAGAVYLSGVIVTGGWAHLSGMRVSLAVVASYVIVIVAASYLRPLRRPPARSFAAWFDRGGDIVVATLVAMFVISRIMDAFPAFAGRELPIGHHLVAVTLVAGAAVVLRYATETLVTERYGDQLVASQAPPAETQSAVFHFLAMGLGGAAFVIFTEAFVGWTWALWVGMMLVLIRSLSHRFKGAFPKVPLVNRITPQGVLKFIVILTVGEILAALLRANISNKVQLLLLSSVILLIPTVLFEMGNAVSKPRTPFSMTWPLRMAGTAAVVFGAFLGFGLISFG